MSLVPVATVLSEADLGALRGTAAQGNNATVAENVTTEEADGRSIRFLNGTNNGGEEMSSGGARGKSATDMKNGDGSTPFSSNASPSRPAQGPQPAGPASSLPFSRPIIALSVNIKTFYRKLCNDRCEKRRQQMAKGGGHRYRDAEGHYTFISDEMIAQRYIVSEVLGKGSFGTVVKCLDTKRNEIVALKITRHGPDFRSQAKLEVDVLIRLNNNKKLDHLVVKVMKVFDWQGHLCIVFEPLSYNLYQLVKCTKYTGVSLDLVRKFAYQMLQVLQQLELHRPPIIHCDLKPENVLLKSQHRSGIRVIDFGSACYDDKKPFRYIQSRFYRSPEVILRLPYGTAIDRWSLGCILVELHTGMPIFQGKSEAAQIAYFEAVLGPIPDAMLENSAKKLVYYSDEGLDAAMASSSAPNPRRYKLIQCAAPSDHRTLEEIIGVYSGGPGGRRRGQPGHEESTYRHFVDLIYCLLRYNADERISCHAALAHPFLEPIVAAEASHAAALQQAASPSVLKP